MHPLSGKTIIFMPGMDGTGISFEPLAKLLPHDVNVKVIQYPADRLLSFEENLQCVRQQVQPDGEAIVIAESFSGPVAVALIGSGLLKARCLILSATFARSPRPLVLKTLRCLPMEAVLQLPLPRFLLKRLTEGGEQPVDVFEDMLHRIRAMAPAKVLNHRLKVIGKTDVRQWLSKLTLPCLYIQASSDRAVPASALFDFTEAVADLRVVRIRGPHFILQAQPQESLAAIQNFMALIAKDFG
ncbi:MAG: alpha/beta hydrolase [Deltaproteobacteria bacterium]|nr:alpha/beta hydrolase [Deltaproteobacteria bacterium]